MFCMLVESQGNVFRNEFKFTSSPRLLSSQVRTLAFLAYVFIRLVSSGKMSTTLNHRTMGWVDGLLEVR